MLSETSDEKKHRRYGISRLASKKIVQWSAEGATVRVYFRAQNHLNLSSLGLGIFDERIKKKNGKFFEENEKLFFGINMKASYFMTEI